LKDLVVVPNPIQNDRDVRVFFPVQVPTGEARLVVVTTAYRKVIDREVRGPFRKGTCVAPLELLDDHGKPLANGLYHLSITAAGNPRSKGSFVLIR
jgi:hypothetical protein